MYVSVSEISLKERGLRNNVSDVKGSAKITIRIEWSSKSTFNERKWYEAKMKYDGVGIVFGESVAIANDIQRRD